MELYQGSDCADALLDMVCYESMIGKLSPEMVDALERHLECCPSCRRKMLGFQQVVRAGVECPNFG